MPFPSKPFSVEPTRRKQWSALPGGGTAVYNAAGLNYIRHKDWLGSTRLATTWAHQVYAKEGYAPFGETYNEAGTADRSFTGQDQDSVSGVFDYFFRKQDPTSGRWLSPDPAGWDSAALEFPQTLNRYAYVVNNPMSLTDPNGLDCAEGGDHSGFYYYCYEQDASYNGPPPSDILPPPSFSYSTYRDGNGNVIFPNDPNNFNPATTDTTKESGCSATQGLQNSSTGCGYQSGGELASVPTWYAKEIGDGTNKPNPGGGQPIFVANVRTVFQIETSPFFSEQQPPPPTNHGKFCHVTSKPGSVVLTYSCNSF